jgi:ABC-type dipeptide/oligopeptide/nickel transport system permease subunit
MTMMPPGLEPLAGGGAMGGGPGLFTPADGGEVYDQGSGLRMTLQAFAENKLALVGIVVVIFFLGFSFIGPHLYHSNQVAGNLLNADLKPGAGHPLGTDDNGFDVLGRMMKGGQSSLEIGILTAIIATVVSTIYGAVAGLVGGVIDGFMMRIVDVGLSIPTFLIILIISARYGATIVSLSIVIGLNAWFVPARLVRGEVLTLRTRDFVHAAKSMGSTERRQVFRHLIPNALSVVIVNITFQVADAILLVAFLGYLGFGLNYPQIDWGDELSNGVTYLQDGYWWLIYPVGVSLILTVMAFNFIGDALRDAVDVRLRKR